MSNEAVQRQRDYYAKTASEYDESHMLEPEHAIAIAQLSGYLSYYSFRSLLDVGAGTGRVMRHLKSSNTSLNVLGVEPVAELRRVAYENNIPKEMIIDGDATNLNMKDDSWDVVCAFGVLHHIPDPNKAVREMCRVAKHGVFISDLNNFGCGSLPQRAFSQTLHSLNLWRSFQWIKNGGRYDKYSEGDGVHYSYSLYDSIDAIREKFPQTFLCNTRGSSKNPFRNCSHASVFAVKDAEQLGVFARRAAIPTLD